MAKFHDWVELTGNTIRTVGSRDVAGLYEDEWPTVRRKLLEEHQTAIENEPKRWKRGVRTASALVYGLTKRLSPERRLLFLIACLVGTLSFVHLLAAGQASNESLKTILSLFGSFAILVFLLAFELIDKLRFRDELELARDLQASLLPREMPEMESLEISAFNRIANTVGGDLYDFAPLSGGRLAILFGDASGHGMAAGLVMAVAQAAFRTQLEISPEPATIMATLNRLLCRTGGPRSFFTACYVILEPGGEWSATVAGHPPILQMDAQSQLTRRIGRGSYPLGIKTPGSWVIEHGILAPGDSLVFCSDGLPEALNREGTAWGYDALEASAVRHAGSPDVCQRILAEWERYTDGAKVEDDVSIAAIRRVS
ncbi:MAG: PP2C family protein-serine/threonine phosphatase [Thermoanaerobaculia bacterium]